MQRAASLAEGEVLSDRDEVDALTIPKLKALLLRDDMLNYHDRHSKLSKKSDLADMVCVLYGY